eukprot:11650036-Ditylum_brightwellii.AAC.1
MCSRCKARQGDVAAPKHLDIPEAICEVSGIESAYSYISHTSGIKGLYSGDRNASGSSAMAPYLCWK